MRIFSLLFLILVCPALTLCGHIVISNDPIIEEYGLNHTSYELTVGESFFLNAVSVPDGHVYIRHLTSSNTQVAQVLYRNEIKGVTVGTVTISAYLSNAATLTCTVTVVPMQVTGIELTSIYTTVSVGEVCNISATILPALLQNETLTYTCSNAEIIQLTKTSTNSSTNSFTALKEGTATITATASNGICASITITVVAGILPQSLTITQNLTVVKNKSQYINCLFLPHNTTNKFLTWTSSNTQIATVNENGKVVGITTGTTVITARTINGLTATCLVTVVESSKPEIKATSIMVTNSSDFINLKVGNQKLIEFKLLPFNTTDSTSNVMFRSQNTSVATVSSSGMVTVTGKGSTYIWLELGELSAFVLVYAS